MQAPTLQPPTRDISVLTDTNEKKIEQDGFDIKYAEDYCYHKEEEKELEEGLSKAYALIFSSYCTIGMQHRIEQHPDFSTIQDNPIALLEAISELMQTAVRA